MPIVSINGHNKRGWGGVVNCLKKVFRKHWLRMKINNDLQIKESDHPRKKNCYQKKQSVENTI